MSHANPTALRLGATGELNGSRYTVRGRVVLSVEIDGETYYWNEFNLVDDTGDSLTLVYEEEESGGVWRLFRYYELANPITVAEAAAKRAGDKFPFEGRTLRVTLVDQSKVRHIEGQPPEGVEVGDVADYFNADAGDRTIVVSWTGDEVEYYEGRNLPAGRVEQAFGLPKATSPVSHFRPDKSWTDIGSQGGGNYGGLKTAIVVVFSLAIIGFLVVLFSPDGGTRVINWPEPPAKLGVAGYPIPNNATGILAGKRYQVVDHAVYDVGALGRRFERREYRLRDDSGGDVFLVESLNGVRNQWHLMSGVESAASGSPYDFAALRTGAQLKWDGTTYNVARLHYSTVIGAASAGDWKRPPRYGLTATANDGSVVISWTETDVNFLRGKVVATKEVLAAFPPATANSPKP